MSGSDEFLLNPTRENENKILKQMEVCGLLVLSQVEQHFRAVCLRVGSRFRDSGLARSGVFIPGFHFWSTPTMTYSLAEWMAQKKSKLLVCH